MIPAGTLRRCFFAFLISLLALAAAAAARAFDVVESSVADAHAAMCAGKLSARQLVQLHLDRIAAYDQQSPKINCVLAINP